MICNPCFLAGPLTFVHLICTLAPCPVFPDVELGLWVDSRSKSLIYSYLTRDCREFRRTVIYL